MSILHIFSIEIWKGYKIRGRVIVCIKYVLVSPLQCTLRVQYSPHNWNHICLIPVMASKPSWTVCVKESFRPSKLWRAFEDFCFRETCLSFPELKTCYSMKIETNDQALYSWATQHQHAPFLASDNSRSNNIRLYAWLWNWIQLRITVISFDFALA